jgi:hypothetical protein
MVVKRMDPGWLGLPGRLGWLLGGVEKEVEKGGEGNPG